MTYHKSNDRVSSELFSDREGESPAVSSPRFRQETNLRASAIAPGHTTGASVRAARWAGIRLDGKCLIISAANRRCSKTR